MQHVGDGQVQSHPLTDLPGIGTAGVDHPFRNNVSLFGVHGEFTIVHQRYPGDAILAHDLAAHHARTLGHGESHTRGIDVSVAGGMQGRLDTIEIVVRVEFPNSFRPHNLHLVSEAEAD